ncbi:MAG: AI-2E family transporter [Pirellulales bacterium]
MAVKADPTDPAKAQRVLIWLACFVLSGWLLYAAKAVLVPIALAILMTFLLAPAVIRLQRLGLPKVAAVLAVSLLAFTLLSGVSWLVARQLVALAEEVPQYRPRVEAKIEDLKESWATGGGFFENVSGLFEGVQRELAEKGEEETTAAQPGDPAREELQEPEAVPVRVETQEATVVEMLNSIVVPLVKPLATAGLVIVLVLFMLLTREDLRNRIVGLSGHTNLAVTTKALDEAGKRIARYLLMQAVINIGYGVVVTAGLLFLGVPYAPLWGVSAAVLRYIPYVGPWVAAVLPLGYSVLTSSGWGQPLGVLALIAVLELFSNNFMEPLLYGRGIGVSAVGVILSTVFWGWLWGPVGLVLATPLTVCLVVAGRHVPALRFFNRLLGDVPEVEPHFIYYQRLLAKDDDEAEDLFDEHVERAGIESACEEVLVPALELAKRDHLRGVIEPEQLAFVLESAQEHLDEVPNGSASGEEDGDGASDAADAMDLRELPLILGYGMRVQTDEAVLAVMSRLLKGTHCRFSPISSSTLVSEVVERIRAEKPAGICLLGLPPGGLTHARTLVRRLLAAVPELKIIVGRWGATLPEKHKAALLRAGATYVSRTPVGTRDNVLSVARLDPAQPKATQPNSDRPVVGASATEAPANIKRPK